MCCFRPGLLTSRIECPNCKNKIATVAGITQKKCPFCGADLPESTCNDDKKS